MLTILRCLETWRLESHVSRGVVRKARTSKAGDDGMIWPSTDVWLITMSNPLGSWRSWLDIWWKKRLTCAFWLFFFCGIPISNSQAVSFWTVSLYSKFQGATLTNKDIVYKSSFPWLKVMQAKWSLPPLQVSWLTCYCCCCCCCCCRT